MSADWNTLRKEARLRRSEKDFDGALNLLARAIEALQLDPNATPSAWALVLGTRAEVKLALEDHLGASQDAWEALEKQRVAGGSEIELANRMLFLARTLFHTGDTREEAGLTAEALVIFERHFGPEHDETNRVRDLIAAQRRTRIKR